eukprot:3884800-Amphidinium_carterae.2
MMLLIFGGPRGLDSYAEISVGRQHDKIRPIDDLTRNLVNASATTREKVNPESVDVVLKNAVALKTAVCKVRPHAAIGVPSTKRVLTSSSPSIPIMLLLPSCAVLEQLKFDGQSQNEDRKAALNAALGGVWHGERVHSAFQDGDTCVRCGEAVENLEHLVHHCPDWNKERRESGLPIHVLEAPPCVRLHGLLPAPPAGAVPTHEPASVMRRGMHTVWTDGSGRHSSNPHFRRCG